MSGYDLYRQITTSGVVCQVIAPALIPRRPGQRIKTDRRDAAKLVRLFRAGELTAIHVPDEAEEAVHRPTLRRALAARAHGQPTACRTQAWRAQQRLHRRYRHLVGYGNPPPIAVTAIARDLRGPA